MKKLSLGISTCPNDTFIFDAMLNGRIDCGGPAFDTILTDVEDLNNMAFKSELDITKISYHAYAYAAENYILLNSGSALGFNNGPLLVSREKKTIDELETGLIAIPGKYTTANLLLAILFPGLSNKKEYLFSDIEDIVLSGEAEAGLLIHENRFTYASKGLMKISDLGEVWQEETSVPIPLGGIAIKRSLGNDIALKVQKCLSESISFAYDNPDSSYDFVRKYAASMEREVMKKHIDLYVNEFSRDLGSTGREAVRVLYSKAMDVNVIPKIRKDIFSPFYS